MYIYLDNAATTKPKPEAVSAINECFQQIYGNPSSAHIMGIEAEKVLKKARENVAATLSANPAEIIFTSGGTESNNTAIKGVAKARVRYGRHIITTAIEHPSVLETCQQLASENYDLTVLSVNQDGFINPEELAMAIRPDTILVSIMHANNETGAIQPIAELGKIIKQKNKNTYFHVDAVQSFGKIPVKPEACQVDLLSISGHKIHGPKGVGALYFRKGVKLRPLLNGGGQEKDLRSGTENVPGIAGMGVAIELAKKNMKSNNEYLTGLRDFLKNELLNQIPHIKINSPEDAAMPNILNVSFCGVKGEVLLHALEAQHIFVSTGAACSSKKVKVSRVLQALGLNKEELAGAIRFSFSVENTLEEMQLVVSHTQLIVTELRKYTRR